MSSQHILPPNATALERALAKAASMPHTPEVLAWLGDSQRCPVDLLPWLAWAMSVDEWQDDWPEARKRAAVRAAVELHRKKGTPWAVLRALAVHGFEDCEIIEYASFLHEWQASGGKYLDGSWQLSGQALSPNVPGARDVVRTAALNHWSHYAIRINSADVPWSRAQQQRLADVARRYAPARSHLVALIDILKASFVATPCLGASRQRLKLRFADCTRISVTGHRHLDGCWLLDADKHTPTLDGSWRLTGKAMRSTYSNGVQLSGGNLSFKQRVRMNFAAQATAGERKFAPRKLGWVTPRLDGSWRLNLAPRLDGSWRLNLAPRLDGSWRLNRKVRLGVGCLGSLGSHTHRLDGSWTLGSIGAETRHIWAHGRITVRRANGHITTEAL